VINRLLHPITKYYIPFTKFQTDWLSAVYFETMLVPDV